MALLKETLEGITPVVRTIEEKVQQHLDSLTKPRGSLGRLEEIAKQYCLITGTDRPHMGKKHIFTFAGDHGVAEEGVSAFPKEVTLQMVKNMVSGGAAVCVLARHVGAALSIVDVGVDGDLSGMEGLIHKKVRSGTANMTRGPAMSPEEAERAIEVGIELAHKAKKEGATLLGTGEMGIGNTTPSSALFSVLLDLPVEDVTGRGTGVDDETYRRKIDVIKRAISVNSPFDGALDALAKVGGLEIAAIAGLVLGGAREKVAVVVDGFISTAGALVAMNMCEHVRDYLFFSHRSEEKGHRVFFEKLGVKPILDLNMRLGEGTGAALAMDVVEASVKIYNEMATFHSAGVSEGVD